MTRKASPPDLESLRRQLGEAILEARLAEARRREQIVRRLEAARAAGVGLPQAARTLEIPHAVGTLRAWTGRWLSFGLAGLVEMRLGPPPRSVEARGRRAGQAQLALSGVLEGAPRPRPRGRSPGNRGGPAAPLLKWPGSKVPIVSKLIALAPVSFERYHEPFLGGGSLFFALRPAKAFVGDANAELVNLYRTVRDEPGALVEAMARHQDSREHYHLVRGIHPDRLLPVERAARTLFLNRTCFNGLYRVNRHGIFNVPYGKQAHDSFFQPAVVWRAHGALQGAELSCEDFEACAGRALPGDFVYLDPPYAAGLNGGKRFSYQASGFGSREQRRVADLFRLLDRRGCLVMASNADCEETHELYRGFEIVALSVERRVGGRGDRRGSAAEIVVRNYTGRRGGLPGI